MSTDVILTKDLLVNMFLSLSFNELYDWCKEHNKLDAKIKQTITHKQFDVRSDDDGTFIVTCRYRRIIATDLEPVDEERNKSIYRWSDDSCIMKITEEKFDYMRDCRKELKYEIDESSLIRGV